MRRPILAQLSNPDATVPGRIHGVRYHPYDHFALIVAVGLHQADSMQPSDHRGTGPAVPP